MKLTLPCYMCRLRTVRLPYVIIVLSLGLITSAPIQAYAADAPKAQAMLAKAQHDFEYWLDHEPAGQQAKPYLMQGRDAVLTPGLAALSLLHLDPRGAGPTLFNYELVNPRDWWAWLAAAMVSWWAWGTAARLGYYVSRPFGVTAPEHFGAFLRCSLPWRPIYNWIWEPAAWWLRQLRHGDRATSGWAPLAWVMSGIFRRGDGVLLGTLQHEGIPLRQPVAYNGPLHVNFCGSSGGGKSTALANILGTLHKKASAFLVDCDAAMYRSTHDWLAAEGHPVVVIDPNNLVGGEGGYNAVDEITETVKRQGIDMAPPTAAKIADGLITIENHHQPVFDEGARDFMSALILFVWLKRTTKNLVEVRHLLANGLPTSNPQDDPFMELLFQMIETANEDDGYGGKISKVIAEGAQLMRSGQDKREGKNLYRSSALRQTGWLNFPRVADICSKSSFKAGDLKTSNPVVFFCAPLTDTKTIYSRLVRVMSVMIGNTFENMPGGLKIPSMMILDEAPSLGRLSLIEVGAPGFRKYGVRLVVCFQDIPALKAAYPETWTSVLSNAGATVWLALEDKETRVYLSEYLGKHTRKEKIDGSHWFWRLIGLSKVPARYQNVERDLMTPEQVKDWTDVDHKGMIVTGKKRPYKLYLDPFWKALPVTRVQPDTFHGEAPLRALTRNLLGRWSA